MEDIFIPTKINRALDGDTVIVETHQSKGEHKGKIEGEVKSIEKYFSKLKLLVRIVKLDISDLLFQMINVLCKIFSFLKDKSLGAVDGHKVLVQITKYADGSDNREGHISAI
ncbi:hypothetical protein ACVNPZ_09745 [Staphylococcus aureus]